MRYKNASAAKVTRSSAFTDLESFSRAWLKRRSFPRIVASSIQSFYTPILVPAENELSWTSPHWAQSSLFRRRSSHSRHNQGYAPILPLGDFDSHSWSDTHQVEQKSISTPTSIPQYRGKNRIQMPLGLYSSSSPQPLASSVPRKFLRFKIASTSSRIGIAVSCLSLSIPSTRYGTGRMSRGNMAD